MKANINPIGIPIILSLGVIIFSIICMFTKVNTFGQTIGHFTGVWLCYGFLKLTNKIKDY